MSIFERLKMILFGALAKALRVLLPKSAKAKDKEGKKKKKKDEVNEEIDAKEKA